MLARKPLCAGMIALCFLLFAVQASAALGGELPNPATLIGGEAVLFCENYPYDAYTLCDAYTFTMPEDWNSFITHYTALAEMNGYTVTGTEEDHMALWLVIDSQGHIARLVPNFRGCLLFIVQQGMQYSAPPTPAPLSTATPAVPTQPDASPYSTAVSGSWSDFSEKEGEWVTYEEEIDCPYCIHGECSLCDGSGTYRFLGVSSPCEKKCSACDGLGYWVNTVREYQYH